jgi:hypothetical protein
VSPIVAEIDTLRLLIEFAQDAEDTALVRRCRKKIRALEAQVKAVAK